MTLQQTLGTSAAALVRNVGGEGLVAEVRRVFQFCANATRSMFLWSLHVLAVLMELMAII